MKTKLKNAISKITILYNDMVPQHLMKAKVAYNIHIHMYIVYLIAVGTYLPCDPVQWKPGCCCIHLSWDSIHHFCRDLLLSCVYIRSKSKVQYIKHGSQLHHGNKCANSGTHACHQPRGTPTVTHTEVIIFVNCGFHLICTLL